MLPILLALMAAQQSALDAAEKAAGKPVVQSPSQRNRSLVQNCDAHKFETMIQVPIGRDGKPSSPSVKMCGTTGQSDAEWIRTLKDAVSEDAIRTRDMPRAVASRSSAAVNAGDRTGFAKAQDGASDCRRFSPPPRTIAKPAAPDYAALPPLPDKPPAPVQVLAGASCRLPTASEARRLSFICS